MSVPEKMSCSCLRLRLFTPADGFVTIANPTTATRLSRSSGWPVARMSESPMSIAFAATCVMPVADPPPETLIFTSLCAAWYAALASSTSGSSAVEPATVIVPLAEPPPVLVLVVSCVFDEHAASDVLASAATRTSAARADVRFTDMPPIPRKTQAPPRIACVMVPTKP